MEHIMTLNSRTTHTQKGVIVIVDDVMASDQKAKKQCCDKSTVICIHVTLLTLRIWGDYTETTIIPDYSFDISLNRILHIVCSNGTSHVEYSNQIQTMVP